MRWCKKHDILIGSRDAQRAADAASEYLQIAKQSFGNISGTISGMDNSTVAQQSDVLILSIPYENIDSTCSDLLGKIKDNCTVISPIVPMVKTDIGFEFIPLKENKPFSHQLVQKYMKNKNKVVSAFHVISEKKLVDPNYTLDYDIFVCGDDKEAIDVVNGLISEISGLRSIFLGSGSLAYLTEIATPLLLNAMIKNKLKNPGIKIL
ncbi:MAG: NAD(P)-binding domain-containing protein [Thaumarchaeota archaeon]|nr:NAD(P)-binding domain-containing protein [Nitrososphaerota archaeon]